MRMTTTATTIRIPHIMPVLLASGTLPARAAPRGSELLPRRLLCACRRGAVPAATIRRSMRRPAAALLLALAALLLGCHKPHPRGRWNVVVVMVDTLRADHLGAYGYPRGTSPRFDAVAKD